MDNLRRMDSESKTRQATKPALNDDRTNQLTAQFLFFASIEVKSVKYRIRKNCEKPQNKRLNAWMHKINIAAHANQHQKNIFVEIKIESVALTFANNVAAAAVIVCCLLLLPLLMMTMMLCPSVARLLWVMFGSSFRLLTKRP